MKKIDKTKDLLQVKLNFKIIQFLIVLNSIYAYVVSENALDKLDENAS